MSRFYLCICLVLLCTYVIFVAADEDLSKLRISELKQRLAAKGVDCHGCAEKRDYINRVRETLDLPDISSDTSTSSSSSTDASPDSDIPLSDAEKRKQDAANPAAGKKKNPLDDINDDDAVNNIVEMLRKQGMNFDVFGKKDMDEMARTGNYDKFTNLGKKKRGSKDSDKPRKPKKHNKHNNKKSKKQRQQEQQQMEQELKQQRVEEMEEEEPIHLHDDL